MNSYPQIHIPYSVNKIKKSLPPLPSPPIIPKKPTKIIPVKPEIEKEESNLRVTIIFYLITICGGALLTYLKIHSGMFLLLLGVGYFILNTYWNITSSANRIEAKVKKEIKYKKDLDQYFYLLENSELIYKDEIENYNSFILPEYKKELISHENLIRRLTSKENLDEIRKNELISFFSKSIKPKKLYVPYQKGVSNNHFLVYLKKYFFDNVYTDLYLPHIDYNDAKINPDFIIIDKEFDIKIAIEIDEPYIGSNGLPIHSKGGHEQYINSVFTNNGWILVRFTESQIIRYTQQCCELIKKIIEIIKSQEEMDVSRLLNLVINEATWNRNEAIKFAYDRYRESYLPQQLLKLLPFENAELESLYIKKFYFLYRNN